MPKLRNPQHEMFAQNLASGMGVTEAYAAAGYAKNPQAASRLRNSQDVKDRLSELMERRLKAEERANEKAIERVASKRSFDKEWVINKLIENVERAMQAVPVGKDGGVYKYEGAVANRSLELLGRELGLFIDRKEVGKPGEFAELDADGLKRLITERLSTLASKGDTTH